ncbi:conserved hypothetical protein [Neospora caninum Liverpool]|uniref:Uncharacterized protein n=1 Tax=Neospora caninum (strain Liverpool) TaxID=572307 RepID=F0VQR3_NEOCL|nr:conserved hypothetical protein [Neospora caninum Liverpool]CBZ56060.1 conserved hypothetical protein [Neospora caninum Liverpool]CEL70808.1 TPA: hypothetical protein BN1204_064860 [Neospora caninum Liverpool]|eukprot:XP_003886086.1 conserved hypothetical protein [Neospora caninum Liverpool]
MKCRGASADRTSPYFPTFLGLPADTNGGPTPVALSVSSAPRRSEGEDDEAASGSSSCVDSSVSTTSGRGDTRVPTGEDEVPNAEPQQAPQSLEPTVAASLAPALSPTGDGEAALSYPSPLEIPSIGCSDDSRRVCLDNEDGLAEESAGPVEEGGDAERDKLSCREEEELSPSRAFPHLSPRVGDEARADETGGDSLYIAVSSITSIGPDRDSSSDLPSLPEDESRTAASAPGGSGSLACSSSLETRRKEQATREMSRLPVNADAGVSSAVPKMSLEPHALAAVEPDAGVGFGAQEKLGGAKAGGFATSASAPQAESSGSESSGKDEGCLLVSGHSKRRGGLVSQNRRSSRVALSAVDDTTPPQSLAWWTVCWPPSEETGNAFLGVASNVASGGVSNGASCTHLPRLLEGLRGPPFGAGETGDAREELRSLAPALAPDAEVNDGQRAPGGERGGGANVTGDRAEESDMLFPCGNGVPGSDDALGPVPFSFCPSSRTDEKPESQRDTSPPARRSLSPPSRWLQHLEDQLSVEIPPPEWVRDPRSRRPRLVSDALWARPPHDRDRPPTSSPCPGGPRDEPGGDDSVAPSFGATEGAETAPVPARRRRGRSAPKARRFPGSDALAAFDSGGEAVGRPFEPCRFPSRSPFSSYPDVSRLPLCGRADDERRADGSMSPPFSREGDACRFQRNSAWGAGGEVDRGPPPPWRDAAAGVGSTETRSRGGAARGAFPRSRRDVPAQPPFPADSPPLTVRDLVAPRIGTCDCGPASACRMCQRTKRGLPSSSSAARRESAAAFAAAADELLIVEGLPPGSYTPTALGTLGTRDVSLGFVERFLGSLLGGDARLGDLTGPGFHIAWMAYHFLRRLSAGNRHLTWGGSALPKGTGAAFALGPHDPHGPSGKGGKGGPGGSGRAGTHLPSWTERGRRPAPACGAKGEGAKSLGLLPERDAGARTQPKGFQLKQRDGPVRPVKPHGGYREKDTAGLASSGKRGEVGSCGSKREPAERSGEGDTAGLEGGGKKSALLLSASACLVSPTFVGTTAAEKIGPLNEATPSEDSNAKEKAGKGRAMSPADRGANDRTKGDLGTRAPPWQTNFGFVDSEWPRFVCGTIDRRYVQRQKDVFEKTDKWALQQCDLSVSVNLEPSPRPPPPPAVSSARGSRGSSSGKPRSSPSAGGGRDSGRSGSSPASSTPPLPDSAPEAGGGTREKTEDGERTAKGGTASPAHMSSRASSPNPLAGVEASKPSPAASSVSRRGSTTSSSSLGQPAPPSSASPSPRGGGSRPSSPRGSSAPADSVAARGDSGEKQKGAGTRDEKKKRRGSLPGKDSAGRSSGSTATLGYEVAVQFEEFPLSAAEWMWPEPLQLPAALAPGLAVQVAVEVRGRFALWWVDAVVESVSADGLRCRLTTDEGCLRSPSSERTRDRATASTRAGDSCSALAGEGPERPSDSPLLGNSKKRARPEAGEQRQLSSSLSPLSLVKREKKQDESEGHGGESPKVRTDETGGKGHGADQEDHEGTRVPSSEENGNPRGHCGQGSAEGGLASCHDSETNLSTLTADAVDTEKGIETDAPQADLKGDGLASPEAVRVDQAANARLLEGARGSSVSSSSPFSADSCHSLKVDSQNGAPNAGEAERDGRTREEETGEEEDEACGRRVKRAKREVSPSIEADGPRVSLTGVDPGREREMRGTETGKEGEDEGKADDAMSGDDGARNAPDTRRAKQKSSSRTPLARGRTGKSAGGKCAFLERLKVPHTCHIRNFSAPQVPAAAPLPRSWRLRPRPLDPEKDLHPGAVLCLSASAASLSLGLSSHQHSQQPSPPFFMRDAVVHRVFFGSDRPSFSRNSASRASDEDCGDARKPCVGGSGAAKEQQEQPIGVGPVKAECLSEERDGRAEVENPTRSSREGNEARTGSEGGSDEAGDHSTPLRAKKHSEGKVEADPCQGRRQREERGDLRDSGNALLRGPEGKGVQNDEGVEAASGMEGPETHVNVAKSNGSIENLSVPAMHVESETGSGIERKSSTPDLVNLASSRLGVSPPPRSQEFPRPVEEGRSEAENAWLPLTASRAADASHLQTGPPATRKATRSLCVPERRLGPGDGQAGSPHVSRVPLGEGRREKESSQSRRGTGGAGPEGAAVGRRDRKPDEESEKASESRSELSAMSQVACYDGVRPAERVTYVHLYFPYGNQQRIVSVEQLLKFSCYRMPYDLHAHFPPESTQTVLRQAHDFLWAIPRALPLVPALTRAKREAGAPGSSKASAWARGDKVAASRALPGGLGEPGASPRAAPRSGQDMADKDVWDEATKAPTREWKESPPFCVVYAALEDSPFRVPQHLQLVQLLQPELDFDALLRDVWSLRFPQWKPPARVPSTLERPLGFAHPSSSPFPCLLHHPSEGPPPLWALTVSLPAWRRLGRWNPYPMDLSAASSPQVSPAHGPQEADGKPTHTQNSQAAGSEACSDARQPPKEQAAAEEQPRGVSSSAVTKGEIDLLRSGSSAAGSTPAGRLLGTQSRSRPGSQGQELGLEEAESGHSRSQAPRASAASLPSPPASSSLLSRDEGGPACGDAAQLESELDNLFASGMLPWANVETLEGAHVDASGRWTASALYLYEKLLFARWAQRERMDVLGDEACMRFTAPYRNATEDIAEPTRSMWGAFALPCDFHENETGPESASEPSGFSSLDQNLHADPHLRFPLSPEASPKGEKPARQALQSRPTSQTGLGCSERRAARLARPATKPEGPGTRAVPENPRAGGLTRKTSPGAAPTWIGDGGLAFSRRPRPTRATAGLSFLDRERAENIVNGAYGQSQQPQGGLVRIVRDPEPPHPIFWDTETDEPPSRRPSMDSAMPDSDSGPSGNETGGRRAESAAFENGESGKPEGGDPQPRGSRRADARSAAAVDKRETPMPALAGLTSETVRCKRPLPDQGASGAAGTVPPHAPANTKVARHQLAFDSSPKSGHASPMSAATCDRGSREAGKSPHDLREDSKAAPAGQQTLPPRPSSRAAEKPAKTASAATGQDGEKGASGDKAAWNDGVASKTLSTRRRPECARRSGDAHTATSRASPQQPCRHTVATKTADPTRKSATEGITVSACTKGKSAADARGTRKGSEAGMERSQRSTSQMRG